MNIIVSNVERSGNGLIVTLAHALVTPEGRRARRILNTIPAAWSTFGICSVGAPESNFDTIDTITKCQSLMGQFANTPLEIVRARAAVFVYNTGDSLHAQSEVEAARSGGRTIGLDMRIRLNLPVLPGDGDRLRKVVPSGRFYGQPNPWVIALGISLTGDLSRADPWRLADDIVEKARAAIAGA